MSVLRQIITLKNKGLSNRAISRQLGLSRKTTNKYIRYLQQSTVSAQELLQLSDVELSALVEPSPQEPVTAHLQVLYSYRFGGPISHCRKRTQAGWGYPLSAMAGI